MKKRNARGNGFYIATLIVLTVLAVLFPLALRCPWINGHARELMRALEKAQYKEAYIGVWGGIIGSVLGVLGAVAVQRRTDARERMSEARRNATMLYYDIFLFYEEMSPFATAFLAKTEWNKTNVDGLVQKKRPILLNNEWIRDVAGMNGVFTEDGWISAVYRFYGAAIRIRSLMETSKSLLGNQAELQKQLLTIGHVVDGRYTWYECDALPDGTENVNVGPILEGLKTFIAPSK